MKRKFLQIFALSVFLVGCSKTEAIFSDSKDSQDNAQEIKRQITEFSMYLDKKIRVEKLAKNSPQPTTPPGGIVQPIDDYVHYELPQIEPQYLWLKDELQQQTVNTADAVLPLSEGMSDAEALSLIEENLYATIDFSASINFNNVALKNNVKNIEVGLVDAIKDDVKNAYLLNDGDFTEAQSDALAEQATISLRNKTKAVLNARIQSINAFPQGLTPVQVNFVSLSLMASVSTIDDLTLMENLDGIITNELLAAPQELPIPAKGLFGKIGKFFGKVVKSVVVIVASAAVVVGGAVLGYINNNSSSGSTASDYTALTGALVGVGVVAYNSKKWWGWVGWNRW